MVIFLCIGHSPLPASEKETEDYPLAREVQSALDKADIFYNTRPAFARDILLDIFNKIEQESGGKTRVRNMLKIAYSLRDHGELEAVEGLCQIIQRTASEEGFNDLLIETSLILADLRRKTQDYEMASQYLEDIFFVLENHPNDLQLSNAYNLKGNLLKNKKKYQESLKNFEKSLFYARKVESVKNMLRAIRNAANISSKLYNYSKCIELCKEGILLARKADDVVMEARLNALASDTERKRGDYEASIRYASQALILYKSISDDENVAKIHGILGQSYMRNCRYDLALEHALNAYNLSNTFKKPPPDIAKYCNNIGNIYERLNKYEDARTFYERSYQFSLKVKHQRYEAEALNNLGSIYFRLGRNEEAIERVKAALELHQKLKNKRGVANTAYKLGSIMLKLKRYQDAQDYFTLAKKITKKVDDAWLNGKIHCAEAQLSVDKGHPEDALSKLETAMGLAKRVNSDSLVIEVHGVMAMAYEALGRYQEALEHTKAQIALNEDITGGGVYARISDLQHFSTIEVKQKKIELLEREKRIYELENEQKAQRLEVLEKESRIRSLELQKERYFRLYIYILGVLIVMGLLFVGLRYLASRKTQLLLKKKNKLIHDKNMELAMSNKAKDRFFSIISHDLKGPLGAMIGLAELLNDEHENMSPEEIKKFSRDIYGSAQQTYKLLENLLEWSRLQIQTYQPKLVDCDLGVVVSDVLLTLESVYRSKRVQILSSIPQDLKVLADLNMLSTILRNLLANAIKFSHSDSFVDIFTKKGEGDFIEIHIKDAGVGMPPEVVDNLFQIDSAISRKGTEGEQGTGLGLIICQDMVRLNGGKIYATSVEGEGSDFFFTLKLCKQNKLADTSS